MAWVLEEQSPSSSPQPKPESLPQAALRNLASGGASAVAGLLGVPGNIERLAESFVLPKPGQEPHLYPEQQDPDIAQIMAQKEYRGGITKPSTEPILPGSEEIKSSIAQQLPQDYLVPQSESEALWQDFAEDLGALMFPFGGQSGSLARKAAHSGIMSGAGNIAKWASKELGVGESGQEKVKLGTMLLSSFGLQPSLNTRAKDMYKEAIELTPKSRTISSEPLRKLISKIEDNYTNVGNRYTADKAAFRDSALKGLEEISSTNNASLRDVIKYKQDLGSVYDDLRKYRKASPHLAELSEGLNRIIKRNPEVPKDVARLMIDADNIYRGTANSRKAVEFARDVLSKSKYSKLGAAGAILGSLVKPSAAVMAAQGAAAAIPVGLGAFAADRVFNLLKNPSIQKEYAQMMSAALKENSSALLRSADRLHRIEKDKTPQQTQPQWILEDSE